MVKINPLKLRKLGAIFKLSQNPQSFFVFFISLFIFGKGKLKTKIGKEIKVSKGENILVSESFREVVALAFIQLMKNRKLCVEDKDGLIIKLGSSEIKIDQSEFQRFDLFLEGLYYIATSKKSEDFKISFDRGKIIAEFQGIKIKAPKNHSNFVYNIYEIFFEEHYFSENIFGKDVIDVGSSIGDSTIYFLKNGAKKVVGYEPQTDLVKIAEENIKINGFEGKTEFINEFFTKDKLRKISDPENTILKLDCEGCEFEIIDEITKSSLKFQEIIFEFHKIPITLFFNILKKGYKMKEIIFTYPTLGIAKFSV
jgi:SAM-dependent methyltransferase